MFEMKKYLRWLFLLIPAVGIILAALFHLDVDHRSLTSPWRFGIHAIAMTAGVWLGCMVIVMKLWEKFPWEKYPVKHLLLEIIFILIYTNLYSYGLYWAELSIGLIEPVEGLYGSIIFTNLITLLITALHEAVEFYKQWKYNFSLSVRLEKDTIEAKYEALKSQVNPHFLFNSLNSLVTLVEENEPAVEYISNLSDFLRYMMKSNERQLVLVREEIEILKKYFRLQKLRFKENLIIEMDVDEKYYHYSTPPLVLQMLAENCLKHNIVSKEKPLTLSIHAYPGWISMENNLQPKNEQESTGQGLRNISERYRFFTTEQVKINQTNTTFRVSVPLLLEEL
jgi:two-component system, LytTR family, sensor kinase